MASGQIRTQDTNFIAAVLANDPVILSQLQQYIQAVGSGRYWKAPARAGVTGLNAANVVFSSFNQSTNTLTTTANVTTIDGVGPIAVNDRFMFNHFTGSNQIYNGIYVCVSTSGTSQFQLAPDANTTQVGYDTDISVGTAIIVEDGSNNKGEWVVQPTTIGSDTLTLYTSNIAFYKPNASTTIPTSYRVTPSGTINGTNMAFTLPTTPNTILSVLLRGQDVPQGSSASWTISGATITFNNTTAYTGPQSGDNLSVIYTA